jgi:hypothetical protein
VEGIREQLLQRAGAVLQQLGDGDGIFVVKLTAPGEPPFASHDPHLVLEYLRNLDPEPRGVHFSQAWTRALELTEKSRDLNREVYLFSDFGWSVPGDTLRYETDDFRLFLLPWRPHDYQDLEVSRVRVATDLQRSRLVRLRALVHNWGVEPREQVLVTLEVEGKRLAGTTVTLDPGGEKEVEFEFQPTGKGLLGGAVVLGDLHLPADDRAWFGLNLQSVLRVALLGSNPRTDEVLQAALVPDSGFARGLKLETLLPGTVAGKNLNDFDVLVLNSVSLPGGELKQVAQAVKNGVGLLYFPPLMSDPARESAAGRRELKLPGIVGMGIAGGDSGQFIPLRTPEIEKPFFAGFMTPQAAPRSPRVRFYYRMAASPDLEPLLQLENGDLFAGLYTLGQGKVLCFSLPLGNEFSDFTHRGLFAPFMHRSVEWVSRRGEPRVFSFSTDGEKILVLPGTRRDWRLERRNHLWVPEARIQGSRTRLFLPGFLEPGLYRILGDQRLEALAAVNLPTGEGGILTHDLDWWHAVFPKALVISAPETAREVIHTGRYGRELWTWLLGAALLLFLGEAWLARHK